MVMITKSDRKTELAPAEAKYVATGTPGDRARRDLYAEYCWNRDALHEHLLQVVSSLPFGPVACFTGVYHG